MDNSENNYDDYEEDNLCEEEGIDRYGEIFEDQGENNDNEVEAEEQERSDEPIYEMTLEIEGESKIIKIYADSDPEELAYNFCRENNLDLNALNYLTSELTELIQKYKLKNDEKIPEIAEVEEENNITDKYNDDENKNNVSEKYGEKYNNITDNYNVVENENTITDYNMIDGNENNNTHNHNIEDIQNRSVEDQREDEFQNINTTNKFGPEIIQNYKYSQDNIFKRSNRDNNEKIIYSSDHNQPLFKINYEDNYNIPNVEPKYQIRYENNDKIQDENLNNSKDVKSDSFTQKYTYDKSTEIKSNLQSFDVKTRDINSLIDENLKELPSNIPHNNEKSKSFIPIDFINQSKNKQFKPKLFMNDLLNDKPIKVTEKSSGSRNSNIFNRLHNEAQSKRHRANLIYNNQNFSTKKEISTSSNINYGEYLYKKGVKSNEIKKIRETNIKTDRLLKESESNTYNPQINYYNMDSQYNTIKRYNNYDYVKDKENRIEKVKSKIPQEEYTFKPQKFSSDSLLINQSAVRSPLHIDNRNKKHDDLKNLYNNQFAFKPKLNDNKKYTINIPYEERSKIYRDKSQEKKLKIYDEMYSKECEYYKPKINRSSSHRSIMRSEDHFMRLYNYQEKYKQNLNNLSNKYNKSLKFKYCDKGTDSIMSKLKEEVFSKIFSILDSDQDNIISGLNHNNKVLDRQMKRIINPILVELKEENETLTREEFIKAMTHLYELMNYDDKNYIINYFKNKKKENVCIQSFRPKINNKSKILANNFDKRMKRSISAVIINKNSIDNSSYFKNNNSQLLEGKGI